MQKTDSPVTIMEIKPRFTPLALALTIAGLVVIGAFIYWWNTRANTITTQLLTAADAAQTDADQKVTAYRAALTKSSTDSQTLKGAKDNAASIQTQITKESSAATTARGEAVALRASEDQPGNESQRQSIEARAIAKDSEAAGHETQATTLTGQLTEAIRDKNSAKGASDPDSQAVTDALNNARESMANFDNAIKNENKELFRMLPYDKGRVTRHQSKYDELARKIKAP